MVTKHNLLQTVALICEASYNFIFSFVAQTKKKSVNKACLSGNEQRAETTGQHSVMSILHTFNINNNNNTFIYTHILSANRTLLAN